MDIGSQGNEGIAGVAEHEPAREASVDRVHFIDSEEIEFGRDGAEMQVLHCDPVVQRQLCTAVERIFKGMPGSSQEAWGELIWPAPAKGHRIEQQQVRCMHDQMMMMDRDGVCVGMSLNLLILVLTGLSDAQTRRKRARWLCDMTI